MNTAKRPVSMTALRRVTGFTLLEMLLAVLVFGLMAAAAYGALNSMSSAAAAQEASAQRLRETQLAVLRLERELRQTLSAGMFTSASGYEGLRGGAETLEFSYLAMTGALNGASTRQMHYRLEGDKLYRLPMEPGLLQPAALETGVLLRGVTRLAFSYLDPAGRWQVQWASSSTGGLPVAVRLDMEIERIGHIERLFELPGDRP